MSIIPSHISIFELTQKISNTIRRAFDRESYWVVGEVNDYSFRNSSRVHYFEFVEKSDNHNIRAKIRVMAWGIGGGKITEFERITGQQFKSNIRVLARVKVVFHDAYGLSLQLEDLNPNFTLGELEAKKRETLSKLVERHPDLITFRNGEYQTKNKSLSLPLVISRIAVISSQTSAGNEDFQHTLSNNAQGYHFSIERFNVPVQNQVNANKIIEAFAKIHERKDEFDAVVVIRGGGAQSDFLIFEQYKIGLAIAKFPIPIITGIGHQKDETIADLMTHTSMKTPTKAAEFIIDHNRKFEDKLESLKNKLVLNAKDKLYLSHDRLRKLQNIFLSEVERSLSEERDLLNNTSVKISRLSEKIVHNYNKELDSFARRIVVNSRNFTVLKHRDITTLNQRIISRALSRFDAERIKLSGALSIVKVMSPENILKKGFAILKHEGKVISNSKSLKKGDQFEILLNDTIVESTVNNIKENHGREFDLPESI